MRKIKGCFRDMISKGRGGTIHRFRFKYKSFNELCKNFLYRIFPIQINSTGSRSSSVPGGGLNSQVNNKFVRADRLFLYEINSLQ